MTTFKVGDKVRRTGPSNDRIITGGEYTVIKVGNDGYEIRVEGNVFWFMSKYFELIVAPSEEKIKVGDNIRVTYEGKVTDLSSQHGAGVFYVTEGGTPKYAPLENVEKIVTPLPTKVGTVIKVTSWQGQPRDYAFLLLGTGTWVYSSGAEYNKEDMAAFADEWQLVYTPS